MDIINSCIIAIMSFLVLLSIGMYIKERLDDRKFEEQEQKRYKIFDKDLERYMRKNNLGREEWKQVKKKK